MTADRSLWQSRLLLALAAILTALWVVMVGMSIYLVAAYGPQFAVQAPILVFSGFMLVRGWRGALRGR